MDRTYRWQTGFYDTTRAFLLPGRDRLLRGVLDALPGHDGSVPPAGLDGGAADGVLAVLEVGCGTGRNLAWLARHASLLPFPSAPSTPPTTSTAPTAPTTSKPLPRLRLCGVDISEVMLETARRRLRGHLGEPRATSSGGLRDTAAATRQTGSPPERAGSRRSAEPTPPHVSVTLARGAAEELRGIHDLCGQAPFDAVYFSYSLSMMPEPARALAEASRLLRTGGTVHVIDFAASRNARGGLGRRVLDGWLALWGVHGLQAETLGLEAGLHFHEVEWLRGGISVLARGRRS